MKTLLVLRHAKAMRDAPSGRDFDRALNERGRAAAVARGRDLRAGKAAVDAIVASPAARSAETVGGVLEGSGLALVPVLDRRIYNASREALAEVLRETGDAVGTLLIVGHNPGLQELVLTLARGDQAGGWAAVAANFPTAALAELELAIDRWSEIGPGCGRVVSFD